MKPGPEVPQSETIFEDNVGGSLRDLSENSHLSSNYETIAQDFSTFCMPLYIANCMVSNCIGSEQLVSFNWVQKASTNTPNGNLWLSQKKSKTLNQQYY